MTARSRVAFEPVDAAQASLSLYEHAHRLQQAAPGRPLPDGGRPFPGEAHLPAPKGVLADPKQRDELLRSSMELYLRPDQPSPESASAMLHKLLPRIIARWDPVRDAVRDTVAAMCPDDPERVREYGRELVRRGTHRQTVWAGLALLLGTAQPEDVPYVETLGLLPDCTEPVLEVLAGLPATAPALMRLAECVPKYHGYAVSLLCRSGSSVSEPATRHWLLRHGLADSPYVAADWARNLAEITELEAALERGPVDRDVLVNTGRLLEGMARPHHGRVELRVWGGARRCLLGFARQAAALPLPLDRALQVWCAVLALDLHSGQGRLLEWAPGEREEALGLLLDVLRAPSEDRTAGEATAGAGREADDVVSGESAARAVWFVHTRATLLADGFGQPRPGLRIEPTWRRSGERGRWETRVMVDGRPVVTEMFDAGPQHAPEVLLARETLWAPVEGAPPREVQLAEAACEEGCCGACYTDVSREGGTVRWRLRRTDPDDPDEILGAFVFDADAYDTEIERAEREPAG